MKDYSQQSCRLLYGCVFWRITNYLTLCILTTVAFSSCNRYSFLPECDKEVLDRLGEEIEAIRADRNVSVSMSDVLNRVESFRGSHTKGNVPEDYKIIPIIDRDNDTLLYLVNYSNGWEILSSDKRTPPVIASGDTGSISLENSNCSFLSWLNSTAIDLKRVKYSLDEELAFSENDISGHIAEWDCSTGGEEQTRANPDTSSTPYWTLAYSLSYNEVVSQVSHRVKEQWDQGYPYNSYCPYWTDGSGNRYDVGCGGLAAGAMLHYMYRKNGTLGLFHDIMLDSLAIEYKSSFNPGDSIDVTARYLRAVNDEMGLSVLINYWQGGTFVLPDSIVTLFEDSGYNCSYSPFTENLVVTELMQGRPVIVIAFDEWILNLADISEGHYFIIDGWEIYRQVTENHYVHIAPYPVPYLERIEYDFGTYGISRVKMNWGWASQWTDGKNDGWYTLTGDWTTLAGSYNVSRHVFHGIQAQ